ncbi:MAG: hypothetical protein AAFO94_14625, partial [Bacteroidota bacterium]
MKIFFKLLFLTICLHGCKNQSPPPEDVIDPVPEKPVKPINPYDGFVKFYEGKIGDELSITMKLIN